MAKIKEKEHAILMRKKGCSIGSIAKKLHVSKSTVSVWCRDISLSESAIKRIASQGKEKSVIGLLNYSESVRQKRIEETKESMHQGEKMLGTLSKRDIFCIGLGLYWGEGYKKGNQEFGFTNSDPQMILFYIAWLKSVFGVKKKDLILRVSINSVHTKRINEVQSYWSDLVKIPLSQFTKASLVKAKSRKEYRNTKVHMGTLRVKVRKGTKMRRQVIGALKKIAV